MIWPYFIRMHACSVCSRWYMCCGHDPLINYWSSVSGISWHLVVKLQIACNLIFIHPPTPYRHVAYGGNETCECIKRHSLESVFGLSLKDYHRNTTIHHGRVCGGVPAPSVDTKDFLQGTHNTTILITFNYILMKQEYFPHSHKSYTLDPWEKMWEIFSKRQMT